jgi:hypothetical protein
MTPAPGCFRSPIRQQRGEFGAKRRHGLVSGRPARRYPCPGPRPRQRLEEPHAPAEDPTDSLARQRSLVAAISRQLPRLPSRWKRDRRLRHDLPRPAGDTVFALAGTPGRGFDELGDIAVTPNPVPDEAQPGQSSFDQPTLRRNHGRQHAVVRLRVIAHQRRVDDRDPPHHLSDHRERPPPVAGPHPGSRPAVSLIAPIDHRSALTSAGRSPACPRFHATRQPAEQNRACSRRGTNTAPHRTQLRVSATGTYYAQLPCPSRM